MANKNMKTFAKELKTIYGISSYVAVNSIEKYMKSYAIVYNHMYF